MSSSRSLLPFLLLVLGAPAALAGPQGDEGVIERILTEGKDHSQVWNTLNHLCDEIGPRLTGSTRCLAANTWARDEFARLGLASARLQQWGTVSSGFDRGPSRARMVAPEEREFEFTSPSWSRGTDGPVRGRVRAMPATNAELEEVGFDYGGCWVLVPPREGGFGPGRLTDEERAAREERAALDAALDELGIAGRIVASAGELVLTSSVRDWRNVDAAKPPQRVEVQVRKSDFEAMSAALAAGAEVVVEVQLDHRFVAGPVPCYNTIAEIPGTEKPEEVVIVSGHLDSWDGPGSKGAQDNGTGSAVVLEAARILTAAGAHPRRTIRFALWTGEEQGLLGSAGYVATLTEEEKSRISCCLVDDGGTNYEGGLVCLDSQAPTFEVAIAPVADAFPELPVQIVARPTVSGGMGSDHASFNAAGIPGFFWMESGSGGREGKNYDFVHHTQHDTQRYAVEEYLVQSATCSAVVAYQLAMAPELLPRDNPGAKLPAPPADPGFRVVLAPPSGEWAIHIQEADVPDFGIRLALETAADGRVRGTASAMGNVDVLRGGSWDPAEAHLTLAGLSEVGPVSYDLRVVEGALVGTLGVMGRELRVRGDVVPFADTPVSGLWHGTIASMQAEISFLFQVRESGEVVGRFQSSQSDSPLYEGRWDAGAGTVRFEYDYPHGGRLPVEARLENGRLTGTIGENIAFEAAPAKDG